MSVIWYGPRVLANVRRATRWGIKATMAACVQSTKGAAGHWWVNRTGNLQGSIKIVEAPHSVGSEIVGKWGSADANYALKLELRQPYLRDKADMEYPKLASRIKARLAAP